LRKSFAQKEFNQKTRRRREIGIDQKRKKLRWIFNKWQLLKTNSSKDKWGFLKASHLSRKGGNSQNVQVNNSKKRRKKYQNETFLSIMLRY